jgi:hypothetical protein
MPLDDWINRVGHILETTDHFAVRFSTGGYRCREDNLILIHAGPVLTDILFVVQI